MKAQYNSLDLANKQYYDDLFAQMISYCNALNDAEKSQLGQEIPTEINSLRQYYEWVERTRHLGNFDLLRIPYQEDPLEIDLNSRKIIIPADSLFGKYGFGVQGDHTAETVYFTCARYFDEMDLSLCQKNLEDNGELKEVQGACWIQWKRPGDDTPHLSLAQHFDVDENDIIFGWTLSDESTKIAGNLEFSVRFLQWDKDDPSTILYSLSTTTASRPIHPSLTNQYVANYTEVEDLSTLIDKRPLYSGIINTAFGAQPVILATGDLKPYVDLGDDGTYTYTLVAYSPDKGTLTADWFQDIYGDEEASVKVLDPKGELTGVVEPEQAGGNYVFTFKVDAAGSYYAVVSNTSPRGHIRQLQSNGSMVPHASNFKVDEQIPLRAYSDGNLTFKLEVTGANGVGEEVPVNDHNGVIYNWYLKKHDEAEPKLLATVTGPEWHPEVGEDGEVYCIIVNKRNKNEYPIRTSATCEMRALPETPACGQILDVTDEFGVEAYKVEIIDADKRDLRYEWFDNIGVASRNEVFMPDWKSSRYANGEKQYITCRVYRSIWPDDPALAKESDPAHVLYQDGEGNQIPLVPKRS